MLQGFWPLMLRSYWSWRPYKHIYFLRIADLPYSLYGYGIGFASMAFMFQAPNYASYVFPGLLVWMLWLAVVIDATYMTFTKVFVQHVWGAVLATPVRLHTILLVEQVMAALKGSILVILGFPFGLWFNAIPNVWGFWLSVPVFILFVMMVVSLGHMMTSFARNEYDFDYVWPLVVTPMFLFSGVLFPVSFLPEWVHSINWLFPMTHVIALVRPLMLGQATWSALPHLAAMIAFWMLFSCVSYVQLRKRLLQE